MKKRAAKSLTERRAMILAAGLGTRMRPLTDDRPKALVEFQGRALIDHALALLRAAGVTRAVVNVHYLACLMEAHLAGITTPEIIISDERSALLDTGGGVLKALPDLGDEAFLVVNVDSTWVDGLGHNLDRLFTGWDDAKMDTLLMLVPTTQSIGFHGGGDFALSAQGALRRPRPGEIAPFANIGYYLVHPRAFANAPDGPFSMNIIWDRAIEAGRAYGMRLDGTWLHLGTPEALEAAENYMALET